MPLIKYFLPQLNIKSDSSILIPVGQGNLIPKILHQTFHSKNNFSKEIKKNIDKIKKINPDWEYRIYDDSDIIDFISDNYGARVLNYFNRINPKYGAARADLFRYLLIYKCGGVYLDIKSTLDQPLNYVLNPEDRYLLSNWKDKQQNKYAGWGFCPEVANIANGEFQQWHVIAAPGHPFLKAVIENVLRNIDKYNPALHGVGKPAVLRVTGPIAYTLAIAPLLHLHQHRFAYSKSEMGLEYSIFEKINDHNAIFKSHYSDMSESLITMNSIKKIFYIVIKIQKKLTNFNFK
jgi:mannosyltransferase OCH1-like enzyme